MQQIKLISDTHMHQVKHYSFEYIKAKFTHLGERLHEVILEINSNKFLIHIKAGCKRLEQFEVLAVKGFIDFGVKVVHFLKKLVTTLYFEY